MSILSIYKFGFTAGIISLLHSAYSAAQHRSYVRITEQEYQNLPIDIVVQAVLSLILVMISTMQTITDFKEIQAGQTKTWETIANFSSFYTFNHRGKSLFSTAE